MAGIWENWMAPDGSELTSCALITTSANEIMAPIHHRMPVILGPQDWETWLQTSEAETGHLKDLLVPAPEGLLRAHAVSTKVNYVANQGPELIEPAPESAAEAGEPEGATSPDQGTLF